MLRLSRAATRLKRDYAIHRSLRNCRDHSANVFQELAKLFVVVNYSLRHLLRYRINALNVFCDNLSERSLIHRKLVADGGQSGQCVL